MALSCGWRWVTLYSWLTWILVWKSSGQQVLQVLYGTVGAENSTYYRLLRPGYLQLTLNSIRGDCDIYVSDKTQKPSYDDYEMQSVTCGIDQVDIPAHFPRPVWIGVYGYFLHEESEYSLSISHIADADSDYMNSVEQDDGAQKPSTARPMSPKQGEEEESLFFTIFVNILKIIVDILL